MASPPEISTIRERRVAAAIIDGKSSAEALREAGFPHSVQRNPMQVVASDGFREAFRAACRKAGLTDDHLAKRLIESTDATAIKRIKLSDDTISEFVDVDHTERRRAVELAAKLLDLAPPAAQHEVAAVQVNIAFTSERE